MISTHGISVLIVVLVATIVTANAQMDGTPILMNRREAGAFPEFLDGLKGKSMTGRMRFGKRSLGTVVRHRYLHSDPARAYEEIFRDLLR